MQAPSRYLLRLISLSSLVAATGCVGTSVGNPPGADSEVKLGVVGTDTGNQPAQAVDQDATIEEAWIVINDIQLRDSGSCSKPGTNDPKVDFPGPSVADLMTGRLYPSIPMWQRDADATYCEMRVSVRKAGVVVEGAPADLAQYGIFVRGARADGTPFELRSDIDEELKLTASGKPEFVLEGGPVGLLLAFNLRAWINVSLLNEAEVKGGLIRVDESNNSSVANSIQEKIPASARLLRDKNQDGKLDEGDGEL